MLTTLVHPNRTVQKNQPTVNSLNVWCSSWLGIVMRLLLATALLLAPLVLITVASSIPVEEDECDGSIAYGNLGYSCDCSSYYPSEISDSSSCGCIGATGTGSLCPLQPLVSSYILVPTNHGGLESIYGLNPDIPISKAAIQCLLKSKKSWSSPLDSKESYGLATDLTGSDKPIEHHTYDCRCEEDVVKSIPGWHPTKGSFSNQHENPSYFGSCSDQISHGIQPLIYKTGGDGDCYGFEYEQFYPELKQSQELLTSDFSSCYPMDIRRDSCTQHFSGFKQLDSNEGPLKIPSDPNQDSLPQCNTGYIQYHPKKNVYGSCGYECEKLYPEQGIPKDHFTTTKNNPYSQHGYEYEQTYPVQGISKGPFTVTKHNPYSQHSYEYEQSYPEQGIFTDHFTATKYKPYLKHGNEYEQLCENHQLFSRPLTTDVESGYETDDSESSSARYGYQYEQYNTNKEELKSPSTTVTQNGLSPLNIYRPTYEHSFPRQMMLTSLRENHYQSNNDGEFSSQSNNDSEQYGSEKIIGQQISPPENLNQHEFALEQSYSGKWSSKVPTLPVFKTVHSVKDGYAHVSKYDQAYRDKTTPSACRGFTTQHGIGYDKSYLEETISKIPGSTVVQTDYPTKVDYGLSTEHVTGYNQFYPQQAFTELSPSCSIQQGTEYEKITSLSPSTTVKTNYPTEINQGDSTEYISDDNKVYPEQSVSTCTLSHGVTRHQGVGYDQSHTGKDISNFPPQSVGQTGYPTKFTHGHSSGYITETKQFYPEQKVPTPSTTYVFPTKQGVGYSQSHKVQDILNFPLQTQVETSYSTKDDSEHLTEHFDQLNSQQQISAVSNPREVLTQQGIGYDHSYETQGTSKVNFPTTVQDGQLTKNIPFIQYDDKQFYFKGNQVNFPPTSSSSSSNHGVSIDHGYVYNQKFPSEDQVKLPKAPGVLYQPWTKNGDINGEKVLLTPSNGIIIQNSKFPFENNELNTKYLVEGLNYNQSENTEHGYKISTNDFSSLSKTNIETVPESTGLGMLNNQKYESTNIPRPGNDVIPRQDTRLGVKDFNSYYKAGPNVAYHPRFQVPHPPLSHESRVTKELPWGAATGHSECSADSLVEFPQRPIKMFDGCSVTPSQLEDILNSFETPQDCVLTVPHLFSGPLDQYAHVMDSFPSSMGVSDGFVHLPSDLIVPFACYRHIASMYAHDLPLFRECSGVVLDDGQFVDSPTVASIIASSRAPDCRLIITKDNLAIPFETYKNYISRISPEDKKKLRILLSELKEPISYNTYEKVFKKYIVNLQKEDTLDENKIIKLLGSKIKLSLSQFLAVINNYKAIEKATVTLPSKMTMSFASFLPMASVLGDTYTSSCLVNIPNTPYALPFTVVKEIFQLYLEQKPFDLSKDTDVNWKFEENKKLGYSDDVETFSTLDKESHRDSEWQNSQEELETEFSTNLDSEEYRHYLLCHPEHLPKHASYNGNIEAAGGGCNSGPLLNVDSIINDKLPLKKVPGNFPRPASSEPVYICERFEKYTPKQTQLYNNNA